LSALVAPIGHDVWTRVDFEEQVGVDVATDRAEPLEDLLSDTAFRQGAWYPDTRTIAVQAERSGATYLITIRIGSSEDEPERTLALASQILEAFASAWTSESAAQ
jgi:hypothetical protein